MILTAACGVVAAYERRIGPNASSIRRIITLRARRRPSDTFLAARNLLSEPSCRRLLSCSILPNSCLSLRSQRRHLTIDSDLPDTPSGTLGLEDGLKSVTTITRQSLMKHPDGLSIQTLTEWVVNSNRADEMDQTRSPEKCYQN
jgi:hypothetical protein